MPTLAELRAMPADDRPETTTTVTLIKGQHLLKEERRLVDEYNDLLIQAERRAEDQREGRAAPRKVGEGGGNADRLAELKDAIAAIRDRLAEFQGEVDSRGFGPGEWQRYKDDHPARENNRDDKMAAKGCCNATDLLNDLGQFASAWNGEPLADGDWDGGLVDKIMPGDLAQMVRDIVDMHQDRLPRVPKAQTSPATESAATA